MAGDDVVAVLRELIEQFGPIMLDAMVAAHLQGRFDILQSAAAHIARQRKAAGPYDQAIRFLEKRMKLTPEQVEGLAVTYGNEAAKITRGMSDAVESRIQKTLTEVVSSGAHVREGMGMLRNAFYAAGVTTVKPYLLETLVRTQTQTAYAAGQWNTDQDPAIQEILEGYELVTVGDDRVRPNHEALDGMKAPKDDPIWQTHWPPLGFGCRCAVLEIFEPFEPKLPTGTVEVDGVDVLPGPDKGFAFNPGMMTKDALTVV